MFKAKGDALVLKLGELLVEKLQEGVDVFR